ncbi:MAG: DUF3592 domain-containing protein [Acidobacteriales bacterium]|nr:DUF3592 domain-containing protein [Terriglobales bacterium]
MTRFQKTVCWLVFLAGLGILVLAIRSTYYRYQMVNWPSVHAEVTRSRVVYASQDRKPRYLAEYHLRYRVNGVAYTAIASVVSADYPEAQEFVTQKPAGSLRAVRYNPDNPAQIAMDPAYTPTFFKLPLILAVVSVAFIFVGGLPLWRESKRLTIDQILCTNCQRTMDRGRRFCPFCKAELVKY